MQENKQLKSVLDDLRLELDSANLERQKSLEIRAENERLRQEVHRLSKYISEQETGIEQHRERIRDTEKAVGHSLEQHRMLEAALDKAKADNQELKRTVTSQAERIHHSESQLQYQ